MSSNVFEWQGIDASGSRARGELQADSEQQALLQLRKRGFTRTRVRPRRIAWTLRGRSRELAGFTRQLATLLRTGVPLLRGFDVIAQGSADARFRVVVLALRADVASGTALSLALARHPQHFDAVYCALVAAGEASGTLDAVLDRLARSMEQLQRIRSRLRSAMMYPAIVLTVAAVVIAAILAWVVPSFEQTFAQFGAPLPWATRMVIAASHALVDHGPWMLALTLLGLVWGRHAWQAGERWRAATDRIGLRLPVIGALWRMALMARWTRTLATMVGAGVTILQALQGVADAMGNRVWRDATHRLREEIAGGVSLSVAMQRSGLFTPLLLQMTALGEESGTLDELLARAADIQEQEFDDRVAGLATLIEPVLVLLLGGLVGAIVIAMYLPVFQLGRLL